MLRLQDYLFEHNIEGEYYNITNTSFITKNNAQRQVYYYSYTEQETEFEDIACLNKRSSSTSNS